jgi:Spy/CpxP family protein refolding chaperone
MKTWNVKTVVILSLIFLMSAGFDVLAQAGRNIDRRVIVERRETDRGIREGMRRDIPGLTEEQIKKMTDLRIAHLKEMQAFHGQIDINRAKYRALIRSDKADPSAINENIDEHTAIRNQMEKKQAAHLQAVRNLLTEEQRVYFDISRGPGARTGMRQPVPGGRGERGAGIMRNQPPFYRGF